MIDKPEFHRLAETIQRARRIVPPVTRPNYDPAALAEPAEIRLHDTLVKARAAADGATDLDRFSDVTTDLADAVSDFFDQVYVMSDEPRLRAARLGLLASIPELGQQTLAWEQLRV